MLFLIPDIKCYAGFQAGSSRLHRRKIRHKLLRKLFPGQAAVREGIGTVCNLLHTLRVREQTGDNSGQCGKLVQVVVAKHIAVSEMFCKVLARVGDADASVQHGTDRKSVV